jgi:hypothetical protein
MFSKMPHKTDEQTEVDPLHGFYDRKLRILSIFTRGEI